MRDVAAELHAVRERIARATQRAGRPAESVRLIAVSKGHSAEHLRRGIEAGCADLGENYVQELVGKLDALADAPVRWHLIGPLQRNKVRHVAARIAMLHTLDSAPLAQELEKRCAAANVTLDVLCQVNVGEEPQKHGVRAEELPALLRAATACPHLRVRGLMTIPPFFDEPERARPLFRALRVLRDEACRAEPALCLDELSMGMSGDFEVAIEEGATLVRIGTAIFGERNRSAATDEDVNA